MASSSMLLKMILVSSGFMGKAFWGDVSEAVETVREEEAGSMERVWMTHWWPRARGMWTSQMRARSEA